MSYLFTDGVCVCQGRSTLQMVAAVRWCQLPDWSCLTQGFPRLSFGTKLLGGESNVTFAKRLYANEFTCSFVFGEHGRYIRNINHIWWWASFSPTGFVCVRVGPHYTFPPRKGKLTSSTACNSSVKFQLGCIQTEEEFYKLFINFLKLFRCNGQMSRGKTKYPLTVILGT